MTSEFLQHCSLFPKGGKQDPLDYTLVKQDHIQLKICVISLSNYMIKQYDFFRFQILDLSYAQ